MAENPTFDTHGADSIWNRRSGETVTIVRSLTSAEADPEAGPMFRVRFADGTETDAFADELFAPQAEEGDSPTSSPSSHDEVTR